MQQVFSQVHSIISGMDHVCLLIILERMLDWLSILSSIWKVSSIRKYGIIMGLIGICFLIMGLMWKGLVEIRCIWQDYKIPLKCQVHIHLRHWQQRMQSFWRNWKECIYKRQKRIYNLNIQNLVSKNKISHNSNRTYNNTNNILSWCQFVRLKCSKSFVVDVY